MVVEWFTSYVGEHYQSVKETFQPYDTPTIWNNLPHLQRSKVKARSHHDITHLHSLINVPTKYQLSMPYSFQDITRTTF